jgi:hypothetical protein
VNDRATNLRSYSIKKKEQQMTTKQTSKTPNGKNQITVRYDSESLLKLGMKVKVEGFVPAVDLKAEFGPEKFTQGIAVLYRNLRMFREVRRAWKDDVDVLGYEWADRRFSKSEVKKIPPEYAFVIDLVEPLAPKYSDFQLVKAKCRYLTAALGGCPVKDTDGSPINSFERDRDGNLQILRYNLRAMITPALAMIGKEQALGRRIGFKTIRIAANGNLSKVERPVNDHGQGKGFCRSERLADGTEFSIEALIPTSILSVTEYLQALKLAGETVGLSPGRSAGFGDFEVIEAA